MHIFNINPWENQNSKRAFRIYINITQAYRTLLSNPKGFEELDPFKLRAIKNTNPMGWCFLLVTRGRIELPFSP